MAKTIACSLNEVKDKQLMDYMSNLNEIGLNNAALIKVALYMFMNENKKLIDYMSNLNEIELKNSALYKLINKSLDSNPQKPKNTDKEKILSSETSKIEFSEIIDDDFNFDDFNFSDI